MDEMLVIKEIEAERRRQIEVEGWTPEHDDQHERGELALAASCYAESSANCWRSPRAVPRAWPWSCRFWKPIGRRRSLIKAAALIVAEIERLDREAKNGRAS